jgi:hypothetical protein
MLSKLGTHGVLKVVGVFLIYGLERVGTDPDRSPVSPIRAPSTVGGTTANLMKQDWKPKKKALRIFRCILLARARRMKLAYISATTWSNTSYSTWQPNVQRLQDMAVTLKLSTCVALQSYCYS